MKFCTIHALVRTAVPPLRLHLLPVARTVAMPLLPLTSPIRAAQSPPHPASGRVHRPVQTLHEASGRLDRFGRVGTSFWLNCAHFTVFTTSPSGVELRIKYLACFHPCLELWKPIIAGLAHLTSPAGFFWAHLLDRCATYTTISR